MKSNFYERKRIESLIFILKSNVFRLSEFFPILFSKICTEITVQAVIQTYSRTSMQMYRYFCMILLIACLVIRHLTSSYRWRNKDAVGIELFYLKAYATNLG